MFRFSNAGKCIVYSKCGCVPGAWTEKMFQRLGVVQSSSSPSMWDYLKDKLGLQKKSNKRDVSQDMDSSYLEPEPIPIPVHSNSSEEMWKPGYRGRTENKRY